MHARALAHARALSFFHSHTRTHAHTQIQPNKLLGVIGEHDGYPVEHIALSHDRAFLSSCSHDNTVKFWNVSYLYDSNDDGDDGQEDDEEQGDEECVAASTQDGDMMAREESIDSSDSDEALPTRVGKGSKQRPGSSASGFYSDM